MKILEIFTGGTIGSSIKDGYIHTDRDNLKKLIAGYNRMISPEIRTEIELETDEPYVILSENLDGDYLNRLIDCIRGHLNQKDSSLPDGIIVTHGTDTLQYTAAALGYVFADSPIPILLVSSNYILSDERANGLNNFYYAMDFIQNRVAGGVFVSYQNENEAHRIHRATRLLSHAAYSDLIYSAGNQFYGTYPGNRTAFVPNPDYRSFAIKKETARLSASFADARFTRLSHVLFCQAFPGQSYPSLSEDTKAVLLESYHSGTLCTGGDELRKFADSAKEKKIPVFLTGVENRIEYASSRAFDDLGIRVLPKASPVAMYIKLWLIASSGMDYADMLIPVGDDFVEAHKKQKTSLP